MLTGYFTHLGSVNVITNSTGSKLKEYSFDPWGRRRNPTDWTYNAIPGTSITSRGFTMHEHMDEFKLINMNGRSYDPVLGQFLSADPFIQNSSSTLNYNRYSYCLNNPLNAIDPSGYTHRVFYGDPEFRNGGSIYRPHYNLHTDGTGGGDFYFGPGYGMNGTGLNGVYYDWYSGTYRSTSTGDMVSSNEVYYNTIVPNGATYLIYENGYINDKGEKIGNGTYGLIRSGIMTSDGTYPTFNSYNAARNYISSPSGGGGWSRFWNSHLNPLPEVVYINGSFVLAFIGGGGGDGGIAVAMKGQDAGKVYLTGTLKGKVGLNLGAAVNVGFARYLGPIENFDFDATFIGVSGGIEVDYVIGVSVWESTRDAYGNTLIGADAGFGPGIGGSVHLANTYATLLFDLW